MNVEIFGRHRSRGKEHGQTRILVAPKGSFERRLPCRLHANAISKLKSSEGIGTTRAHITQTSELLTSSATSKVATKPSLGKTTCRATRRPPTHRSWLDRSRAVSNLILLLLCIFVRLRTLFLSPVSFLPSWSWSFASRTAVLPGGCCFLALCTVLVCPAAAAVVLDFVYHSYI